jgi:DNA-binding protein HU-beta
LNNKTFISELSQRLGRSADEVQLLTYTLVDAMNDFFQEGDSVALSNFGTFEVKKRMERIMVSPTTKKKMLVPPKLVLGFKPSATIKEKMNTDKQ